jgi:AcrR family transcriptional regulator
VPRRPTSRTAGTRLDSDARRAQILDAARRLWSSRPYSQVSTAELAEAAGVARGLLHHYFGSKRELYLAVVRDVVRVPELPESGPGSGDAASDVWEASVDGWMHLMEAGRDSWRGPLAGAAGPDPELEAILDESKELVVERTLQALGVDPALAPDALRALVRGYGGLTEEITREWLERGRLSREEARLVLLRTLPLLLEEVLPDVLPRSG